MSSSSLDSVSEGSVLSVNNNGRLVLFSIDFILPLQPFSAVQGEAATDVLIIVPFGAPREALFVLGLD